MTFIYTKPKCESGKLIKTRCECKVKKLKKITVKKKTLKKKKSTRNKTVKKAPKKVKKSSAKLLKKYQEEWAMIPENYLLKTPRAKQLETTIGATNRNINFGSNPETQIGKQTGN